VLFHLDQAQQTQTQQQPRPCNLLPLIFMRRRRLLTRPKIARMVQLASQGQHQQPSHSNIFGSNNDYSYNERIRLFKIFRLFGANLVFSSMNHTLHSSRALLPATLWLFLAASKVLPQCVRQQLPMVILLKFPANRRNLPVVKAPADVLRPLLFPHLPSESMLWLQHNQPAM
jgi:hypothetical protein